MISSLFCRYEGTGRSLSLKLVQQLRQQSSTFGASSEVKKTVDMITKTDNTSSTATGKMKRDFSVLAYADNYKSVDKIHVFLLPSSLQLDVLISVHMVSHPVYSSWSMYDQFDCAFECTFNR